MDLFGKKARLENEALQKRVAELEASMTPEMKQADSARKTLSELAAKQSDLEATNKALTDQNNELSREIAEKQHRSMSLDESLDMEEYGIYAPRFAFANSTQYKDALKDVRSRQKEAIKRARTEADDIYWTVNQSRSEGKKMVRNLLKLMLRSFNTECDDLVGKVKTSNIDKTVERIQKSSSLISDLGKIAKVSIPQYYVALKIEEAQLAYEFSQVKEAEKEAIREAREREREERRVQKEIEEKRKLLKKEQQKYTQALEDAKAKLDKASDADKDDIQNKINELEGNLAEVDKGIRDVDYREANLRAGYVYIISNVGSFGDGIYKIGMTRRLEPMDRIRELGDASVPFGFDVHALIFSDDAPALEAALHNEFADRKLNLVNQRREFFKCSLDEIKNAILKSYDKTVEFVDYPEAEQFRTSEKMRSGMHV